MIPLKSNGRSPFNRTNGSFILAFLPADTPVAPLTFFSMALTISAFKEIPLRAEIALVFRKSALGISMVVRTLT